LINLKYLNLVQTQLSDSEDKRILIFNLLPSLECLDFRAKDGEEVEYSEDESDDTEEEDDTNTEEEEDDDNEDYTEDDEDELEDEDNSSEQVPMNKKQRTN
jgi:hypothetical protein